MNIQNTTVSAATVTSSGAAGTSTSASPSTPSLQITDLEKTMKEFYFDQAETAIHSGIPWASFFVMAAAIHYIASLESGRGDMSGKDVVKFIEVYLAKYDAQSMYSSFRCGLFHRGAPTTVGATTPRPIKPIKLVAGQSDLHDPKQPSILVYNAEDLLNDIKIAFADVVKNKSSCVLSYYNKFRPQVS